MSRSAVLKFYFLTGAFCMIALSFTQLSGVLAAIFLILVLGLTLRLLRNLGALSFEVDPEEEPRSGAEEKP